MEWRDYNNNNQIQLPLLVIYVFFYKIINRYIIEIKNMVTRYLFIKLIFYLNI